MSETRAVAGKIVEWSVHPRLAKNLAIGGVSIGLWVLVTGQLSYSYSLSLVGVSIGLWAVGYAMGKIDNGGPA